MHDRQAREDALWRFLPLGREPGVWRWRISSCMIHRQSYPSAKVAASNAEVLTLLAMPMIPDRHAPCNVPPPLWGFVVPRTHAPGAQGCHIADGRALPC